MAKFQKRPVVIDAVRWTGDNISEVDSLPDPKSKFWQVGTDLMVKTQKISRGEFPIAAGEWVVRDWNGELYPMDHESFVEKYVAIEDVITLRSKNEP